MKFINTFHFMDMIAVAIFLQTAMIIQGQYISPLTAPHPIQATNSTVVITATATISSSAISNNETWILSWKLNKTPVAQVGYAPYPIVRSLDEGFNRITVSATSTSASSFTTQLTIAQLKTEEDGYEVQLYSAGVEKQSLNLAIKNCNVSLSNGVIVAATSRIFNSPGKFACSNGRKLFYSNGTMLTSSDTTCLASAEWSGQDNLQCWTAPSVSLASSSIDGNKLTVVEGNDLTLTCSYDDVIPAGKTSQFYVGGNSFSITKGEPFTLSSLQRSDNNKVVSCQAVTSYTDLYPNSGRSSEYTLDVLYAPQQDTATTSDDCIGWCVGQNNASCSVVFYSIPRSQFASLTKNDQVAASDGSMTFNSDGDQQTFEFYKNEVTSSDNGTYTLTVKSSNKDIFPDNVQIIFHIIVADEPPPTPGLSIRAIIGISGCAAIIFIIVAAYAIFRWRRGTKMGNENENNCLAMKVGTPGHVNLTTKREPDYVVMSINQRNVVSSSRKYENIEGAYQNVISAPQANAQPRNQGNVASCSRNYKNVEGCSDEVISASRSNNMGLHSRAHPDSNRTYENIESR
ncbi:uncharacterized protein LOC143445445 [Clavelina lepadiformis]|uniref:uncharacterized protein LOC143445445 n=1 Tax=Clavelina lepadiformis TaxID=159417 RepID=UPI0040424161